MHEGQAARVTVISLNTRGVPMIGSRLAARYAVIGDAINESGADVVCLQEVFTWWHLRLLARHLTSYRHASYRVSPAGPAAGLVTFSRLPVYSTSYRRFGLPPKTPGISPWVRFRAAVKGAVVTDLRHPALRIVNTHPVANRDGDWSPTSRFYRLHRAQFDVLAQIVARTRGPLVLCGDFNVAVSSPLFRGLLTATDLTDAFEGACPPTFRAEYLPPGETPHCLDFILAGGGAKAEATTLMFAEPEPQPGWPGHVSDHIGLSATLFLTP